MSEPMTLVEVDLRRPGPDGTLAAEGVVECVPTLRRTVGTHIVLPAAFTARLVGGMVAVRLDPTGPDWCWRITERMRGIVASTIRHVLVPDSAEPVPYALLVDVDPSTMEPSPEALDGWTATIDQVAGLVSVAGEHRAAASTSATAAQAAATEATAALDAFRALTDITTDGEGRWWLTLPTVHTGDGIHIIQTGASENE